MELLWKGLGLSLLCCILGIIPGKNEKEHMLLLAIAGCTAVLLITISYLTPVIDFLKGLESLASLHSAYLSVIIKACGVGLIAEVASLICTDAGNQGLGKGIHILGSAVIIWLSIPVFNALLEMIGIFLEDI